MTGYTLASRDDDINLQTHKFGRKRGHKIWVSLWRSPFNDNVFSLHVAKLAQALAECLGAGRHRGMGGSSEPPYSGTSRRLLRQRGIARRKKHGTERQKNNLVTHRSLLTFCLMPCASPNDFGRPR